MCTCSRVHVTPMDNPNKQICRPVMFLSVLCVAVQMVSRSWVQRVNRYAIPQLLPILPKALVWICLHMYQTFLNPLSNCALDISLPFENVSYEFFAVQLIREETGIHFFASSISNARLANTPPPPDSTVNWDSRSNKFWPSPCQSASHYYEKGKVSAKHVT